MKRTSTNVIRLATSLLLAAVFIIAIAGCGATPQQQQAIQQAIHSIQASTASAGVGSASVAQSTRSIANSTASPAIHATGRRAPTIRNARPYGGGRALPAVSKLNQKKFAQSSPITKAVSKFIMAARSAPARVATIIPISTYPCTDGGTMDFGGEYNAINATQATFIANISFTNCKEIDVRDNGVMVLTGTDDSSTNAMTIASIEGSSFSGVNGNGTYTSATGLHTTDFFMMNFTVLVGTLTSNASLNFNGAINDYGSTGWDMTFNANGTMSYTDYMNAGMSYSVTFTNFSQHDVMPGWLETAFPMTYTSTINGSIAESWTASGVPHTLTMTYTNFILVEVDNNTYTDSSISGGLAMASNQTGNCDGGGSFTFSTQTPIRYDFSVNHTTAGQITTVTTIATVNATIVTTWNADGSLSVSINGQTVNFNNEAAFQAGCQFGDMNTNNTNTTTSVGTGQTVTTSAGSLTATLTWQDPLAVAGSITGTDVDMDLHLYYYTLQAPTINDFSDTHIFYGNTYSLIGSSTYEGTLDYDWCAVSCTPPLTVAQGPEHITLTGMPPGYYILAANAWAINAPSTSADVTVMLQIGNNLYNFPAANIAASGGDMYNTPNAWFRVTDIVVDANGTATLITPNLNLWPARTISPSIATKTRK